MKIFFCEGCGKRLTDSDIEHGSAVDKKMAGIFCQKCGAGVSTQETSPKKPSAIAVHAPAPRATRNSQTRVTPAAVPHPHAHAHPPQRTSGAHPALRTQNQSNAGTTLYMALGAGALVLLLLFGLLLRDSSSNVTRAPRTVSAPVPEARSVPVPPPITRATPSAKTEEPSHQAPEFKNPQVPADIKPSREDLASKAFDEVRAFKNLPESNVTGRIAALEAFNHEYGDTMAGARARTMIKQLKEPTRASTDASGGLNETINDPVVAFARGVECSNKGDKDTALKYYNRAIELNPNYMEAFSNRSELRRLMYDFDGALADAQKAVSMNPNMWQTQAQLASSLLVLGRGDEALPALQKVRSMHQDPDGLEKFLRMQAQNLMAIAQGKQYEGKTLTDANELERRGRYRLATKRYAEGIQDLEEAVKTDPTVGARGGYQLLMFGYEQTKDWKNRLDACKRWLAAAPQSPDALNGMAWELLTCKEESQRDPKAALEHAKKATDLSSSQNPAFLDTYAMALARNGKKEEALAAERKAVELLPPNTSSETRKEYEKRLKDLETQ